MIHNRIERYPMVVESTAKQNQTSDMLDAVRPAVNQVGNVLVNTIRKQPLASIAVGLAIGVALGCLIKRR